MALKLLCNLKLEILMKKLFAAIFFFPVFCVEVAEDELKVQEEAIEFENYGGPHAIVETAQAIMDIGIGLGSEVAENLEHPQVFQLDILHSVFESAL